MRTVTTIAEVREALAAVRAEGRTIGLVPTMGFFHDGHLSLMRAARIESDFVVVSLFVNPTQFGESDDLEAYPRDLDRDATLAEAAGVDLLFIPVVDEIYPPGYEVTVSVGGVTAAMEGEFRPGHFDGVATVVSKLFNIVQPDAAWFGQKDAQQVLMVRKLVRDLNIPVRIEVGPTIREDGGLAMSSRNAYLSEEERLRAGGISRALRAAEALVDSGERDGAAVLAAARAELEAVGIEPEYLELRSEDDLAHTERINGNTLLAVAARVGKARLIDNTLLGGT